MLTPQSPDKGPAAPTSEAEREIFLGHFTTCCFLHFFPHAIFWSSKTDGVVDDISKHDVDWLVDMALSYYDILPHHLFSHPGVPNGTWSAWSTMVAEFFSQAHCQVSHLDESVYEVRGYDILLLHQCPWYRCLPQCSLWWTAIFQVCRKRGWAVPDKLMLLRNRFVRWVWVIDTRDGKKIRLSYPCGRDFSPPPDVKATTSSSGSATRHPSQQQRTKLGTTFPLA